MITEAQIQAVMRRIVEGYAPDRIILFGACAYGVPTKDSNLDLFIIKQDAEARRAVAVWSLLWDTDAPAMDISIRTLAAMKRTSGIFQSVETLLSSRSGFCMPPNTLKQKRVAMSILTAGQDMEAVEFLVRDSS